MSKQISLPLRKEVWLPVVGYEGYYEVSNNGRVKSLRHPIYRGEKIHCYTKSRILKMSKTTTGYWKVELSKKGVKRKSFKVHRLVGAAFIKNTENKPNINHIDGNPLNNKVENLEWCTQSENMYHAYQINAMKSKLYGNEERIKEKFLNDKKASCNSIGLELGIDPKTIKAFLISQGFKMKTLQEVRCKVNPNILYDEFRKGTRNIDIIEKYNLSSSTVKKYKRIYKRSFENE